MIHRNPSVRGKNIAKPHLEFIPPDSHSSFYIFRLNEPNLPFAWHYHPELEIDLFLEGEGLRFVGDSVENFHAGDLCLLGPNLPHSWTTKAARGKRMQSIFLQFLPDCLGSSFFEKPEMRHLRTLLVRSGRGLSFYGKTRRIVMEKIIALEKLPAGDWKRISDLIWILGELATSKEYKALASVTYAPTQNFEMEEKLNHVLHFINADSDVIPSQEAAARHARMSPQAFSRFFKRTVGKNYAHFRNEIRINRACRNLIALDENIVDVALRSGFNNLSNFNEQFLRIKGVTPRDYRQRWKNLMT
jgi:AraC-like DNA-binding protein